MENVKLQEVGENHKTRSKAQSKKPPRPYTRANFHDLLKRAINPKRVAKPAAK